MRGGSVLYACRQNVNTRLWPGLDPAILEELEAANIRAVIWLRNDDVGSCPFTLWGLDDTFRIW